MCIGVCLNMFSWSACSIHGGQEGPSHLELELQLWVVMRSNPDPLEEQSVLKMVEASPKPQVFCCCCCYFNTSVETLGLYPCIKKEINIPCASPALLKKARNCYIFQKGFHRYSYDLKVLAHEGSCYLEDVFPCRTPHVPAMSLQRTMLHPIRETWTLHRALHFTWCSKRVPCSTSFIISTGVQSNSQSCS